MPGNLMQKQERIMALKRVRVCQARLVEKKENIAANYWLHYGERKKKKKNNATAFVLAKVSFTSSVWEREV